MSCLGLLYTLLLCELRVGENVVKAKTCKHLALEKIMRAKQEGEHLFQCYSVLYKACITPLVQK